jgi:small subunit ribosomal protein S15e
MSKLRKAKTEAPPNEKPATVKTHLRNMIVVPEMIGSVIGIYNGKLFNTVEIKPEMTGHYLAEFSISYVCCVVGSPNYRNPSSTVALVSVLLTRRDSFH